MILSRRAQLALFAVAVLANLVLLYWPRSVGAGGLPHLDKLAHLTSFALVAWTGLRAGLAARWLSAALVTHAVTSELIQHTLLSRRSGEAADVLADLGGVVLGLGVASWRHERSRERDDRKAPGRQSGTG